MRIEELKSFVQAPQNINDTLIWILKDDTSSIIANQYIRSICSNNNLSPKYIESVDDISDEGFIEDDNLYIIQADEVTSVKNHSNCIILCNKCNISEATVIPKLEDWQVVDYVLALDKGIPKAELDWMVEQYKGNYGAFISDMKKISIFPEKEQYKLYEDMIAEGQFLKYTKINIFDLSNALIKRDKEMVKEVLKVMNYVDIEPLNLLGLLYNGFRNVIDIQTNPKSSAESLGISDKQYYVIQKHNCGFYSRDELVKILKLLTNLEYEFKFKELDISSMINYIIINILGV